MLADENIPFLIASMAFVVICLLFLGVVMHVRGARYRRAMIDKIRAEESDWAVVATEASSLDLAGGPPNALVRFLSSLGMRANPGKSADDMDIKLKFLKAGLRDQNVPTVFWGTKLLLVVALPLAFLIPAVLFFKTVQTNHLLLGALFMAVMGLYLPDRWLRARTAARREKLTRAFPDMLDLLVVCVEAGMGLDAAISRVG